MNGSVVRTSSLIALFVAAVTLLPWASEAAEPAAKARVAADAQDFVFFSETRPLLVRLHVQIDGKPLQAAWDEFIKHVFKSLDTNGDGVLSKEEAERMVPPPILFSGNFVLGRGPAFQTVNQPGITTREQLASYYRKSGGGPFQVQGGSDLLANQPRLLLGNVQPPSSDALNDALFALLDTNKDGKLSKEELAAAPAILLKLDANDDEMISPQELLPSMAPADGRLVVLRQAMTAPANSNANIALVSPGEPSTDLPQRLQARYGPKDTKQNDKKLSRKELGLDETTFRALDTDGDGRLDAEELARFAQRAPDIELTIRLGKTAAGEQAVERVNTASRPAPFAPELRRTVESALVLELGSTRIELRADATRRAAPPNLAQVRERMKAQFKADDTDNNGYLDMKEARESRLFAGVFKLMDRDGDGKLYEKEMLAYLDEMQDLQTRALAGCASLSVSDGGRGLFDLIDTDRDGLLSVREMCNAFKLLEQFDRDGDGCISRAEVPHSYQLTVTPGPANFSQLGTRVLAVSTARMPTRSPPVPLAGPLWFRKMDRNHDGDVSRREFLGTDEEFRKIDTDGDGLISREEAEKADALFRKQK
jgi:Ca2+-binding EF-hand superfamily protein